MKYFLIIEILVSVITLIFWAYKINPFMSAYIVGVLAPLLLTLALRNTKKGKNRGLPAEVSGEPGYAIRNYRFTTPVETAWAGIKTLADLFEQACNQHRDKNLLGTRKVISKEKEVSPDGRSFEKLHLGDYEWMSYSQVFQAVCSFSSGLVQVGHKTGERVAIFADTREEWFIALQVDCIQFAFAHLLKFNINIS